MGDKRGLDAVARSTCLKVREGEFLSNLIDSIAKFLTVSNHLGRSIFCVGELTFSVVLFHWRRIILFGVFEVIATVARDESCTATDRGRRGGESKKETRCCDEKTVTIKQCKKEQVWSFFGCCTADSD